MSGCWYFVHRVDSDRLPVTPSAILADPPPPPEWGRSLYHRIASIANLAVGAIA